jgi:Holliday junction resolvase RusA-like endonuclease
MADNRQDGALGEIFRCFVLGKPEPAGSKNAMPLYNKYTKQYLHTADGRPVINVVDDAKGSKAWKRVVAALARRDFRGHITAGAVRLTLAFTLTRPKHHLGSGRNAGIVKDSAPAHHIIRPDVLKLTRAVEDALTGIVWEDDSQIIDERLTKRYGTPAGVLIVVERIPDAGMPIV